MNTKFVFFFLVAACLAQSFETRRTVISPNTINKININIEEVIKDVENALFELIVQLPEILSNLENKINDIINSENIAIENQVDKILKNVEVEPSVLYKCVENEEAAVKQLDEGLADCKEDANAKICKLSNDIEKIKHKARKFVDDNVIAVKQCIDENKVNLIKVGKCLKEHLQVIRTEATHLIEEIRKSVEIAKEKSIQVSLELTKCVAGVKGEAESKQKVITNAFIKCIKAQKEEQ